MARSQIAARKMVIIVTVMATFVTIACFVTQLRKNEICIGENPVARKAPSGSSYCLDLIILYIA